MKKYYVFGHEELKKSRCLGCEVTINEQSVQCFLVYHKSKIFSYINSCPHTGVNLDWIPHQFLNNNNDLIQCSTHGALFKIDDGYCIQGPCVGKRLKPVGNAIIDNNIYLIL